MQKGNNSPILISITPGSIIKAIVIFLILYLLYVIRDLVLVILSAVILASSIEPATRWFGKYKIPRVLAVVFIYFVIALILTVTFYIFLPPLLNDISNLSKTLPDYINTLSQEGSLGVSGFGSFFNTFSSNFLTPEVVSKVTSTVSGATFGVLTAASSIFGGLLSFILIVVISFYLAVQEDGVTNFLRVVTPIQNEKYIIDLWKRSQRKIGLWMQGQLLLAVIVGVLIYLGLWSFGVPNPMFLALIAMVMELIPIFGPFLAAIPAIGFAVVDGGATLGLITAAFYVIIQQFESQLIHPLVVKKIVGIPALVAIISLIIGAKIAGFLGIIIAVPVAAALMEFLSDVEKKKLGKFKEIE